MCGFANLVSFPPFIPKCFFWVCLLVFPCWIILLALFHTEQGGKTTVLVSQGHTGVKEDKNSGSQAPTNSTTEEVREELSSLLSWNLPWPHCSTAMYFAIISMMMCLGSSVVIAFVLHPLSEDPATSANSQFSHQRSVLSSKLLWCCVRCCVYFYTWNIL